LFTTIPLSLSVVNSSTVEIIALFGDASARRRASWRGIREEGEAVAGCAGEFGSRVGGEVGDVGNESSKAVVEVV